jgi:glyoxylase-like metal-dependent hydrolase (beta-lactamase superfamily II)
LIATEREFDRRTILRATACGVGALCLPYPAAGQPASADLEITKLDDMLFVIGGVGCNVVVAQGPGDGAAMVDGGLQARADELLSSVRNELSIPRIDTLFNSCWHPEQTGSNQQLAAAGARIVAHENTRLWLGRDITRPWDERTITRLPPEARPTETFYDRGAVKVGGRDIYYGYMLQAHTDGDMYVHFPAENVLVTGAAVSANTWPLLDWWTGGWIGGLIDGLNVLLALADEDTRVVPGLGGLLTRDDLLRQHEMYVEIFDRLAEMFFAGLEAADVLAAEPTRQFDDRFGDPELFLRLAFRGFGLHFGPDA